MSKLDFSSDADCDLSEIKEDVSVQIVKSSTQAQFLGILNNKPQNLKKKKKSSNSPNFLRPGKLNTKLSDLFTESKSPIIQSCDINQRCFEYKAKVKAKIEKMAQDQEELRKKDCPFRPQLLNNKRSSRNLNEFLAEMKNFEISKDKKLVNMRFKQNKGENLKEVRSKPTGVHEKLYIERKILKKPWEKSKNSDIDRISLPHQLNYSDSVLAEKFKSEFFDVVLKQFTEEKSEFEFDEFCWVLIELNFIRNDESLECFEGEVEMVNKAWAWVADADFASCEKVLQFLLDVMNYCEDDLENLVHQEFISFYECRHWFVINKRRKKKNRENTLTPNELSVSPCQITRKSLSQDQNCENYLYIPTNIFNKDQVNKITGNFPNKK
jgi:hypothetical protein